MKTYTALFAIEVHHYGFHAIEAEDDQAAITGAESLFKADTVEYPDPEWANAVCARIVHITDPDGRVIAYDRPLDPCFVRSGGEADRLLCDKAGAMLEAIREIARTPLWGERIEDEDLKVTLAETGEYDLDGDEYFPSADAEHDQLRDVVETARAMLAELEDAGLPHTREDRQMTNDMRAHATRDRSFAKYVEIFDEDEHGWFATFLDVGDTETAGFWTAGAIDKREGGFNESMEGYATRAEAEAAWREMLATRNTAKVTLVNFWG